MESTGEDKPRELEIESSPKAGGAGSFFLASDLRAIELAKVDPVEAVRGLTPFVPNVVLGAWKHRHKAAFTTLAYAGVSDEAVVEVLDPYTRVKRKEDFRNIFQHNLAVGFLSAVLADWLVSAGRITPDERDAIVVHGMTHDATKPYEIFRRRFHETVHQGLDEAQSALGIGVEGANAFSQGLAKIYGIDSQPMAVPEYARALAWSCIEKNILPPEGTIEIETGALPDLPKIELDLAALKADTYYGFLLTGPETVRAHESLPEALRRSEVTSVIRSALIESRGYGGNPETFAAVFEIGKSGDVRIEASWIHKIIMLADNMTCTSIPEAGQAAGTYFVTCRERQVISNLAGRYPGMATRGLARNLDGGVRDADVTSVGEELLVGNYLQIQWLISKLISAELALIQSGKVPAEPDVHIKKSANTALKYYQ